MEFLRELWNWNTAPQNLTKKINFAIRADETQVLSQKLEQNGITPTITNIKHYLIRCLTLPLDELPPPERTIILRSGRPERN